MSKERLSKQQNMQAIVTVIVHGISAVGISLSKTLLKQGGRVVILDQYRTDSKNAIRKLKKLGDIDFVDLRGASEFYKTMKRIDYVFYMQNTYLERNTTLSNHDFLAESNILNLSLQSILKYKAKFVLVSSATISNQLSTDLISSDNNTVAPYSTVELQKYSETLTAEYYDKSNAAVRILRLGAVLENGGGISGDNIIVDLFLDAIERGKITIKGEGLHSHFLISEDDAVYGILKLAFDRKTAGEVIALCNDRKYTTLSIAYKILELNSQITQIEFVANDKKTPLVYESYIPTTNAVDFGWKQKDTLEESILKVLKKQYKKHKKTWNLPSKPKITEKQATQPKTGIIKTPLGKAFNALGTPFIHIRNLPSRLRTQLQPRSVIQFLLMFTFLGVLFYYMVIPITTISVNGFLLYKKGKGLTSKIQTLDFDTITNDLDDTYRYSQNIGHGLNGIKWAFTLVSREDLYSSTTQLVYGIQYALRGASDASEALLPLAEYAQNFEPAVNFDNDLASTTREYRSYLEEMETNQYKLERSVSDFLLANQAIQSCDSSDFPHFAQSYITDLQTESNRASELIIPYEQVVSFLPELLGIRERKRYLILLQNPSELRSSGGWISSYGVIGVEGGQIRELFVDDVYNLDGLLKTSGNTYTAPNSMRETLDISDWNLSLSNWDPDFSTTANSSSYFMRESGKAYSIDGVIAINIPLIQNLADQWGGIEITGEPEPITSSNLYDKIFEMHSTYTPGSDVKATFLSKLANQTLTQLLSSDIEDYVTLSDLLFESLEKKDLIIYVDEYEANKFFSNRGWSGIFHSYYTSTPTAVEWNWGGNKSNLFLTKETDLQIEVVDKDKIRYTYKLIIANNSATTIYPEGDYVNYFRLYLPENAQIETINGFKENVFDISYENNGFKVVGGWFNVPIKATKTLQVQFSTKRTDSNTSFPINVQGENISGTFVLYKQPGDSNHTNKVNIFYPHNWAVLDSGELSSNNSVLSIQYEVLKDQHLEIIWKYK